MDAPSALLRALTGLILASRSKGQFESFLEARQAGRHPRVGFRGLADEQLAGRCQDLVDDGTLGLPDVAAFVDGLEENGAQHVFLTGDNYYFRPVLPQTRMLPAKVAARLGSTLSTNDGGDAENTMTSESNPITIVAVRSSLEADLEHEQREISNLKLKASR